MANLEEFNIEGDEENKDLSFDINEDDLLKELEALSPNLPNTPSQPARAANFSMIRTGPADLSDFNVENMVLTPEDENNPELLAELSALIIDTKPKVPVTKESAVVTAASFDPIKELKKEILELKRRGDIEGAKAKLKELNNLEKEVIPKSPVDPITNAKSPPAHLSAPIISTVPLSATATSISMPSTPKPQSSDTQIYRDLFAKLQKQSATCQTISDFYTTAKRNSDANLFIKRKQALDLETQKLRLMLKSKQPAPQFKTVNVTYEYMLSNPEVPEGQLQVSLGQLKVILPRKFKLKDTEEYKLRINYELFGLNEKEINLTSEPFTTNGLISNTLKPFLFKCNKKDLRVIKSVEYKKMRLEIISEAGFLFFKSDVIRCTGQCKLDRLLKDCTLREDVDLFDVEDGKKSAIPSAKIGLTAKIRSPLTSDGFKQNTEKWTVIPIFGYSNQTLYSDLSPPPPALSSLLLSSSPKSPKSITGTFADNVKSFEVIEYELGLLRENENVVLADSSLMDLQVALESLRDRIQMQVELGQISLENYLNSVKECINDTKKLALEAKRSGDLKLAQKYVKHVDIMRKEVAEAEASMAEAESEAEDKNNKDISH